jgi:hypothetical protein
MHSIANRLQSKSAQLVLETNLHLQRERAENRMRAAEQRQNKIETEKRKAAEREELLAAERERIAAEIRAEQSAANKPRKTTAAEGGAFMPSGTRPNAEKPSNINWRVSGKRRSL